ncbi:MAG: hypothetical protein ACI8RD_005424 [Bacillariaceae sp.]|jgi:hypothetical protein
MVIIKTLHKAPQSKQGTKAKEQHCLADTSLSNLDNPIPKILP